MSLIQEALRRREEEEGRAASGLPTASVQPPREPIRKDRTSRSWLALFALMMVILVMLGAALGLLVHVFRSLSASGPATVAAIPEVHEPAASAAPIAPEASGEDETVVPDVPAPVPEQPVPAPAAKPVPAIEPAQPIRFREGLPGPALTGAPAPAREPSVARAQASPAPAKSGTAAEGGTAWPDVRLAGVLTKANPRNNAAILNGEIIGVGEDLDGVVVREVETGGVLLEYQGEQRFLRVGRSLR